MRPKNTGKTIFTSGTPVPLIQRLVLIIFSLEFVVVAWFVLEKVVGSKHSVSADLWRVALYLMMACWGLLALVTILGLPPFQSKRRK